MNFPKEVKYTKDHEWAGWKVRWPSSALRIMPRISWDPSSSSTCPPWENPFKKGETLVTVDSVKAVAEVYAPFSGQVEAVNESLRDNPEWINRDAMGKAGWSG